MQQLVLCAAALPPLVGHQNGRAAHAEERVGDEHAAHVARVPAGGLVSPTMAHFSGDRGFRKQVRLVIQYYYR